MATAVGAAVLFGLAPALQTVRKDLVEPLKDASKGASGGFRRGRLRNALVVFEVALSLVLLSGAGLLMRSFVKLQQMDLGFNPENILYAAPAIPARPIHDGRRKTAVLSNNCCHGCARCQAWWRRPRRPGSRHMAASAAT